MHSQRKLKQLAITLGEALTRENLTIATAESCTGGWIAKLITDISGSSEWFGYGFVTYSNAAKAGLLGVSEEILASDGAVSEAAVRQMAAGARAASGADLALAVSGVAGPGGGSPDKPVGTVWFAWAGPGDRLSTELLRFPGNRDAVRRATAGHALKGMLDIVNLTS